MLFLVMLGEDSGRGCTGCTGATEEVATGNDETGNRAGWSEPPGYKCWQDNTSCKMLITDGQDTMVEWWPNTLVQVIPDYTCFPTFSILIKCNEIPSWRKLSI